MNREMRYLVIADADDLDDYEWPLHQTLRDVLRNNDIKIPAESSAPEAWAVTLAVKSGYPYFKKAKSIWLPDAAAEAADEEEEEEE